MSYQAEISRDNPSCFLFLIDQSASMEDEISLGEEVQQLASGVADSINRWLQELSIKCAKSEGIRDYYNVGVIGYGKNVGPSFVGSIADRELIPISEIADNPARLDERTKKISDGAGGLLEQSVRIPVWFDPIAEGGTPMCRAATEARRVLENWIAAHPDSFPPIVIHITDGESTDGNPTDHLNTLTSLSTSDGNVMLFNIHLSANPNATPVSFSDSPDDLPDAYSKMLFETSSPLTPAMRGLAKEHGFETSDSSRCFVLNADLVLLVQAIDIG
ncbi:MAG: VWA domain-containing protein, partial [Myxococcales bacterium]|nr:VWA domain-containing protein [Myxococcales bacterium]